MSDYAYELEAERARAAGHAPFQMDRSASGEYEHRLALAEEAIAVLGLQQNLGWNVVERYIVDRIIKLRRQLEAVDLDLDRQRLYAGELSGLRNLLEHVSRLQQQALDTPTPDTEEREP